MQIQYTKRFVKQLAKQPSKIQDTLKLRLRLFQMDIHDPLLRNHALQGSLKGFYSISITGDIRAVYQIVGDEIYLYEMIGSHSQLYG